MSNVTFIIGNGFDLSLGLKTSYRDFYDYVKNYNSHPKNRIYKAIQESPETWGDFEITLGQYTHYIDNITDSDRKKQSIDFHEELEEFREDLASYLSKEEKKIENLKHLPNFTGISFYEELPAGQVSIIHSLLTSPLNLQFITLNYTNVLHDVLSKIARILPASMTIRTPHSIHGTLQENLTLGVSDETQLSTSMSGSEKDDLIKPSLIYSMNDGRIETLKKMINGSDLIVLFGTSIGETDKYIWEMVNNWLNLFDNRHLIIHKHDNTYSDSIRISSRRQKQFNSNVQDRVLRYSGLDGDNIATLKSRIYVIHNTKKLFSTGDER